MRSVVAIAAVSLVAAIVVPRLTVQMQARPMTSAMLAAQPASPAQMPADSRSVVIRRGSNGHFEVSGSVDGRAMDFMVDTGASVVALSERTAAELGIHPAQRDYVALVRTANGTVHAAPTRLGRVEIQDLVVRDVDAMVLPDSALSDNLLGLSFLSRLRRFEYSDGQLVLEQ